MANKKTPPRPLTKDTHVDTVILAVNLYAQLEGPYCALNGSRMTSTTGTREPRV